MTSTAGNKFLVESALLAHGLPSVSDADLLRAWAPAHPIVWVDQGRVVVGGMDEFLLFRARAGALIRIDRHGLDAARARGLSGALTASGTMRVCAERGVPLTVTCGMGGIGDIRGEELCPDLPALAELPVALISTSPKDMLDIPATFAWLRVRGVSLLGRGHPRNDGYVFRLPRVDLDGTAPARLSGRDGWTGGGGLLLLNPIPPHLRTEDLSILERAVRAGHEAERRGLSYHPAVNGELDRLTGGHASRVQFASLAANADWAEALTT